MLNPIIFSIPEKKIIKDIPIKTKILSDILPGELHTYIYTNETEYYLEYARSYFGITMKKAGWDCMRHYEIIANGCIPYFINIDKCPPNTMALWPKELLIEGIQLYDNFFKNKNIDDLTIDIIDKYNKLLNKLLDYTRSHLTTKSIGNYIIGKTNLNQYLNKNLKILFISGDTSPDYLRCLTLHGLKEIYGDNCHDFPKIEHIYKNECINYNKLYGKGFTYTNLLDQSLHNDNLDKLIIDDIITKKYDLIIYGSYHRGMPLYDLINKTYEPNRIVLLCGEDLHCCNHQIFLDNGHIIFVREL
jgi:hypothetical protein